MRRQTSSFVAVLVLGSLALGARASSSGGSAAPSPHLAARNVPRVPTHGPVTFGDALPDDAGVHLAINLRLPDEAGLDAFLRAQQDRTSPSYHAWLTPESFGARFGLSEAAYARVAAWLGAQGFTVTRYPNRLFLSGEGTIGGARRLLGVQPRWATRGGRTFRSYTGELTLPPDVAPLVEKISGLDTRPHLRHRLDVTPYQEPATQALGAGDLRALYDVPATGSGGGGASGETLVVLGTQEGTQKNQNDNPAAPFIPPSTTAVNEYLTSIAEATATFNPIVLPNPTNDFDYPGSNSEYQLDVEMQSVGAPDAKTLDLVLAPEGVVFETGAQYIVNTLSTAIVVSTSIGICESEEIEGDAGPTTAGSEAYVLRTAVKQGLTEGQTWFAAAGDSGADDCNDDTSDTKNGFGGGNATVDFPCSIPEFVCMGGTQFPVSAPAAWDPSGNLTAYQTEVDWNEGDAGGAGGGGQSMLYAKPTWQAGVGPKATDGARDLPDLALMAATLDPGVAVYDCGSGQQEASCGGNTTGAGSVDIFGGTSIASPLGAGLFAHLAGQLGCRLGDIHPALYALGLAQQDGGAQPFHDITSGNNDYADLSGATIDGFAAAPGYDLATGWGSVDVAKLIDAWPPCTSISAGGGDGGAEDGGPGVEEPDGSTSPGGGGGGTDLDAGAPLNDVATPSGSSGCSCAQAGLAPARSELGALAVALGAGLVLARRRRRNAAG